MKTSISKPSIAARAPAWMRQILGIDRQHASTAPGPETDGPAPDAGVAAFLGTPLKRAAAGALKVRMAAVRGIGRIAAAPAPSPTPFADMLAAAAPPPDMEAVRKAAFAAGVKAGKAEIRTRHLAFMEAAHKAGASAADHLLVATLAVDGDCTESRMLAILAGMQAGAVFDRCQARRALP